MTGRVLRRIVATVVATWVVAVVVAPAAHADGPTVTGAGSTWVQIALEQWRADAARFGLSINYQGIGSSAGRQFFIIGQTDFAASEIPFEPSEKAALQASGRSYQYVPDVAGGTALMYNLKDSTGARITNLGLSSGSIAGIFTGKISYWDDPAIVKDNGGRTMPHQKIIPVIRSDGSGTSAKLADYLAYTQPGVFKPFMSANNQQLPMSFWPSLPGSVAQRSSDGVANYIASDQVGSGSIGYVEAGYALYRRFPVAGILNKAGKFALPSSTNVATALKHATLNADLTQNLVGVYNAPEATAYPLASYSYLITQTTGFDPAKGAVLGAWMIYIACAGQKSAAPLGYSPLPANLVKAVFDAIRRIPGAPTPPSTSDCDNPTLTGAGFGGGGYGDFVTVGGATTGGGNTGGGNTGDGNTGDDGTTDGDTTGTGSGGTDGIPGSIPGLSSTDGATVTALSAEEQALRFQQAVGLAMAASDSGRPAWVAPAALAALIVLPVVFGRARRYRFGAGRHTRPDAVVSGVPRLPEETS